MKYRLTFMDCILIVEAILIVIFLGLLVTKPSQPCTLTFEIQKGRNFDQPYPVYSHCSGSEPATVIGDIHGNK